MTTREVAQKLGVSPTQLGRAVRNKYLPRPVRSQYGPGTGRDDTMYWTATDIDRADRLFCDTRNGGRCWPRKEKRLIQIVLKLWAEAQETAP